MKIVRAADYESMSRKAANLISAQVILYPRSVLGLATGSTPLGIYRQLVNWYEKGDLDFSGVRTVNLDEYRGLSPENPNSYHFYMWKNFFEKINIRPENVMLPDGTAKDPEEECARYEAGIASLGGIDMQLLGLGNTGHIGFNEPDNCFDKLTHLVTLDPKTIEANARLFSRVEQVPRQAFTMGIKTIMQAKKILLVVSGRSKAPILKQALFGPVVPKVPASILQLHPNVTVIADKEALSEI